jgi:hypothetical protein
MHLQPSTALCQRAAVAIPELAKHQPRPQFGQRWSGRRLTDTLASWILTSAENERNHSWPRGGESGREPPALHVISSDIVLLQ